MPIYYRTFPGNIPDSRSVGTVLDDIKDAGFPDITLITDRGYESIRNLERYILDGQRLIAWAKVNQKMVTDRERRQWAPTGKDAGRRTERTEDCSSTSSP